MPLTTIPVEELRRVVEAVREAEGECPTLINLETVLRYCEANERPVYLEIADLILIEMYL